MTTQARALRRSTPLRRRDWFVLAALLAALIVVHLAQNRPRFPVYDEVYYLGVAHAIHAFGVFGVFGDDGAIDRAPAPGMAVSPLQPAFLAGLMALDPTFEDTVDCVLRNQPDPAAAGCRPDYGAAVWVQLGIAAVALALVWVSALVLAGRAGTAHAAAALVLASGVYTGFADHFLTEILSLPLLTGFSLLLALAFRDGDGRAIGAAGLTLGLLALVRPSYAYLVPLVALLLAGALVAGWPPLPSRRTVLRLAALFATGYLVAVGPWLARNMILFDTPTLTRGYAGSALGPRVAYNDMTAAEWAGAFLYWLPDFGDGWAGALLPPSAYARLDLENPEGYYRQAARRLAERHGPLGPDAMFAAMIREDVLGNLPKHVAVTLPLAWRGAFVADYWSLATLPLLLAMFAGGLRRRRTEFVLFCLPAFFMLGFHAFTTINIARYNVGLVAVSAVAAAVTLTRLAERSRGTGRP